VALQAARAADRGREPAGRERLNREINAGLRDPALTARLTRVATTPILFMPDEFGTYMAAEVAKWAKVVKAANIKPE
jgi:tripartite-type tricarboxylate transporter receptor subunit TctC